MEQLPNDSDARESNSLAVIVDSIGAFLGRVPASLQRNAIKTIGHLIKIPMAHNDGRAEEIKAISEARVKIIKATGTKLAQAVEIDSSLAQIATQTHASKILRQQKNAIGVLKYAVDDINSAPQQNRVEPTLSPETDQAEPKEISDDWLNAFESEAVNMSSEQMQRLFGKMLAGEICKPSTFSIRTVKLMGQMDSDVAQLFQRFCSMSFTVVARDNEILDSRVLIFNRGNGNDRFALSSYDLSWIDIETLAEYGLINEADASELPYGMTVPECIPKTFAPIRHNNKYFVLRPIPPKLATDFANLEVRGIALSRVGKELLSIVEMEENKIYDEALGKYLESEGLRLVEI
jgi:hypothetical protein